MKGSAAGARGRAYALDAATGEIVWTFWSCPGPGEFGNDTWAGTSWKTGGAVPWIHPAIDPDLGLVYWAFGNPYPRTDGSTRAGTNLFANSLVALDAKTGKRRWHFQSVHHDIWDCDNVMAPCCRPGDRRQGCARSSSTAARRACSTSSTAPPARPCTALRSARSRRTRGSSPGRPSRSPAASRSSRAVPERRRRHPAGALLPHGPDLHAHLGPADHHLPRRGRRR